MRAFVYVLLAFAPAAKAVLSENDLPSLASLFRRQDGGVENEIRELATRTVAMAANKQLEQAITKASASAESLKEAEAELQEQSELISDLKQELRHGVELRSQEVEEVDAQSTSVVRELQLVQLASKDAEDSLDSMNTRLAHARQANLHAAKEIDDLTHWKRGALSVTSTEELVEARAKLDDLNQKLHEKRFKNQKLQERHTADSKSQEMRELVQGLEAQRKEIRHLEKKLERRARR